MAPSKTWTMANLEPQAGKTVLICEAARHMAPKGALVTIAVRRVARGRAAAATIRAALAAAAPHRRRHGPTRRTWRRRRRWRPRWRRPTRRSTGCAPPRAARCRRGRAARQHGQQLPVAARHRGRRALAGVLRSVRGATPGARVGRVSSDLDGGALARADAPSAAPARSVLASTRLTRERARRLAAAAGGGATPPVLAVLARRGWTRAGPRRHGDRVRAVGRR